MGYRNTDRASSQSTQDQQERPITDAQFADNRISSTALLQIQGMINSSPQAIAQRKVQASLLSSPITQKQIIQRAPQGAYASAVPSSNGMFWDTQGTASHASTEDKRTATVAGTRIAVMQQPGNGGTPSVEPEGWGWLRAKFLRLKGDWVRFHMINAKLGGPGNHPHNLLPTTHAMNHDSNWRNIEDDAKISANTQWTYLEVTPTYDGAYPAGIPRSISAEWGNWSGSAWNQRGALASLSQQNPATYSDPYGDASVLSLGQVKGFIASYMPPRKQKRIPAHLRAKALSPSAIKKPPLVTAAYKAVQAEKLLTATYADQNALDDAWNIFLDSIEDKKAINVWHKIMGQVYLREEGVSPYSLIFRKK